MFPQTDQFTIQTNAHLKIKQTNKQTNKKYLNPLNTDRPLN